MAQFVGREYGRLWDGPECRKRHPLSQHDQERSENDPEFFDCHQTGRPFQLEHRHLCKSRQRWSFVGTTLLTRIDQSRWERWFSDRRGHTYSRRVQSQHRKSETRLPIFLQPAVWLGETGLSTLWRIRSRGI